MPQLSKEHPLTQAHCPSCGYLLASIPALSSQNGASLTNSRLKAQDTQGFHLTADKSNQKTMLIQLYNHRLSLLFVMLRELRSQLAAEGFISEGNHSNIPQGNSKSGDRMSFSQSGNCNPYQVRFIELFKDVFSVQKQLTIINLMDALSRAKANVCAVSHQSTQTDSAVLNFFPSNHQQISFNRHSESVYENESVNDRHRASQMGSQEMRHNQYEKLLSHLHQTSSNLTNLTSHYNYLLVTIRTELLQQVKKFKSEINTLKEQLLQWLNSVKHHILGLPRQQNSAKHAHQQIMDSPKKNQFKTKQMTSFKDKPAYLANSNGQYQISWSFQQPLISIIRNLLTQIHSLQTERKQWHDQLNLLDNQLISFVEMEIQVKKQPPSAK